VSDLHVVAVPAQLLKPDVSAARTILHWRSIGIVVTLIVGEILLLLQTKKKREAK